MKMQRMSTRDLTAAAVCAALYVVLTVLQNLLLPGSASAAVQFRAAEALCVLTLFSPSAIAGLGVGCLLFNLTYSASLPLDWLVGTSASLLAGIAMYGLRKVVVWRLPLPALLMPALFNGVLVGWELTAYVGGAFWLNALCVAAGELGVLLTLGVALYFVLQKNRLGYRLFGR